MAKAPTKSQTVVLPRKAVGKATARVPGAEVDRGQNIPNDSRNQYNVTARDLRNSGQTAAALRLLAKEDGTVSTAVFNYVQVAMSGYKVRAYDSMTHQYSPQGTQAAMSVLASFDTLYDYTLGFSDKPTIDTCIAHQLREVALLGSYGLELVLNKARLPDRLNVIAAETLQWKSNGQGGRYPAQQGSGEEIELNIPTFWVTELQRDANRAYAVSMLDASIKTAFYYLEFIEDMRKVVRRSGHSRMVVKLNAEKVRGMAPDDVKNDPKKLQAFMETVREETESVVSSLEPEDALVTYDSAEVDQIHAEADKADYTNLLTTLSGLMATSLKSHPSILGLRLSGSQSLSNTESLVFLKCARAIQVPVEAAMSRALTLAVRLYGVDVYVKFEFDPINLRPEDELESFRTMKIQNTLQLLSLGYLTDDEAAAELGTGVRGPNAPDLSGTMFFQGSTPTDNAKDPTPNDDPMGRSLQPDTPKKAGGRSQ